MIVTARIGNTSMNAQEQLDRIQKDIKAHANVCLSEENDRLIDAIQEARKLIWSHPVEAEQILTKLFSNPETALENDMTQEQESDFRKLARETYNKTRIGRPHMPDPDSDEGQRKIDRLFDIIVKSFR